MDGARSTDDGGYWYHQPSYYSRRNYWIGGPSRPAATGVALLSRELAGRHGDEHSRRAGDFLLGYLRQGRFWSDGHLEYATYYASQGMFQLGGDYWEKFGAALYSFLLPRQTPEGYWPAAGGHGTVYATSMYVLALTVSYRQLPIYQR